MNKLSIAKRVINTEINALHALERQLDQNFNDSVDVILNTTGRTIICGMGKSGIIGKKIAASFASTGTPSFFMHPGEAFHGDLGMVTPSDVFIAISNSGETDEVLKLLPFLKDNGNKIIAITGNPKSTLAIHAQFHLNIAVPEEACPLKLAPTSSTTATLVMGDALTISLMESRNFLPENFARFHPGGSLGRKLLLKVKDEMHSEIPIIESNARLIEILDTISQAQLGLVVVKRNDGYSIITDGDIRRGMRLNGEDFFNVRADSIATSMPHTISMHSSIQKADDLMSRHKITSLLVVDGKRLVGILKK
jgi:arabinose-5-phosphate isomerase